MGCCPSTNKAPKTNPDVVPPNHHHRHHHHHSPESDANGRATLSHPQPPEEETVKEVLSETPIPKPPISIQIEATNKKLPKVEEAKIEPMAVIRPTDDIISEVSEFSDMASFSESFSTTTVTDKRDDDGEVNQRVDRFPAKVPKKRPCSGEMAGARERKPRSPARRQAPSPERRSNITSRSAQDQTTTTKRRNVGPPNGIRRDPGEGSGRRSRSPVTRGEAAAPPPPRNRNPILTRNGLSGDLSPVKTAENGVKREKPNDGLLPETNNCETLEDPLVSLECFIFL